MKLEPVDEEYFNRRWDSGDVIGRYTLLARIAVGGMAEIWLARQMGLKGFEKVVVIKRISDNYSSDPVFVEMFLDEARIAAQLDHPNIVQIHDLGEHRGAYYIAMEYLHGEDLAMTVRTGARETDRLPFTHAAYIIAQAAEGLASAHQKKGLDGKPLGVVHRDVSPQNIFVTYEGVVKVLDFGVAKAANRASSTQGGQLKGRFAYMAPEHARGDEIDSRADVWSLGVVLFEAVTVSRLFDPKQDPMRLMKEVASTAPVPLARSRHSDVPPDLEAIIDKALQRDPAHRYQSANELKVAIDRWLHSLTYAPSTVTLSQYMHKLFADRIGRKSALIESARSGEIKFFKVPEALQPDRENSMPEDTKPVTVAMKVPVTTVAQVPRKALLGGAVAAAALVLGGALWSASAAPAAELTIDTDPEGARIEVDGVGLGTSPLKNSSFKPGKHVVLAQLEGRGDQAKAVTLVEGKRTEVRLVFPPLPGPVAPSPEEAAAEPPLEPLPTTSPPHAERPSPRGKLSIETNPWTQVFLNGKKLGETPLIGVSLPAGRQRLKLVNEGKGINRSIEVTIQAGRTTVERRDLSK